MLTSGSGEYLFTRHDIRVSDPVLCLIGCLVNGTVKSFADGKPVFALEGRITGGEYYMVPLHLNQLSNSCYAASTGPARL